VRGCDCDLSCAYGVRAPVCDRAVSRVHGREAARSLHIPYTTCQPALSPSCCRATSLTHPSLSLSRYARWRGRAAQGGTWIRS
jgi:hypothetical protein